MGMFDDIRCEMRLPTKNDSRLRSLSYQAKDLGCCLVQYAIRGNGNLVDTKTRMEIKPGAPPAPKEMGSEWFDWCENGVN